MKFESENELAPESNRLFENLTRLQKGVVTGVLSGLTNIAAYRQAGGMAKSTESAAATAAEILRKPNVRQFLESVQKSQISEAIMTREEALQKLTILARSSITDVCSVESSSVTIKPNLTEDQSYSVREITHTAHGVKVKLHSAIDAIKAISRLQGWEAPEQLILEPLEREKREISDLELARKMLFVLNKAVVEGENANSRGVESRNNG